MILSGTNHVGRKVASVFFRQPGNFLSDLFLDEASEYFEFGTVDLSQPIQLLQSFRLIIRL